MFLQIEVATESFSTNPAGVWFLIVVCVHVKSQIVDLMEGLIAYVAFVGFFTTMSQFVIFVVTFLMEAFTTEFTHKWFIARMDASVSVQS